MICSEKQAIDASLRSLSSEDPRFCPIADRYWNARGGSHTDGGAFIFTIEDEDGGGKRLTCTDKFGRVIKIPEGQANYDMTIKVTLPSVNTLIEDKLNEYFSTTRSFALFEYIKDNIRDWDYNTFGWYCNKIKDLANEVDRHKEAAIEILTLLNDRRFDTGIKKRIWILHIIREALHKIFASTPLISEDANSSFRFIDWERRDRLQAPGPNEKILIIDTNGPPPREIFAMPDSSSRLIAWDGGDSLPMVIGDRGSVAVDWAQIQKGCESMYTTHLVTTLPQE